MERASAEELLKKAYSARVRGDVDGCVQAFTVDATFAIAGDPNACSAATSCVGAGAIRSVLSGLMAGFEFLEHDIVALIIDGDRAAVHARVRVRVPATGQEAVTETVDLVAFKDGKIASFVQFCDTALAGRMALGTVAA